jgi:hypothetical protein
MFAAASYGLGETPAGFFVFGLVTAAAGVVFLPTGLVLHLRARKELRQRADARIEKLFAPASQPPAQPSKPFALASPTLWLGPLTVRF